MPKPKNTPEAVTPTQVSPELLAQARPLILQAALLQLELWDLSRDLERLLDAELDVRDDIDHLAIGAPTDICVARTGAWLTEDSVRELLAEWLTAAAQQAAV